MVGPFLASLFSALLYVGMAGFSAGGGQDPASAFHVETCDASIWDHVYHGTFATAQERLTVIDECITVTGTMEAAFRDPDGDRHIRIRVDAKYKKLLNA